MLEREHSTIATLSKEEISVQAATPDIAKKRHLAEGDPILFRKRFVYDQGERPMEFNLATTRWAAWFTPLKAQDNAVNFRRESVSNIIFMQSHRYSFPRLMRSSSLNSGCGRRYSAIILC